MPPTSASNRLQDTRLASSQCLEHYALPLHCYRHCAFPRHQRLPVGAQGGANHALSHRWDNFVFDAPHFDEGIVRFVMARHGGAFPVGRREPQSCTY